MNEQMNTSEQFPILENNNLAVTTQEKYSPAVTSSPYPLQMIYREIVNFYKEYIEFPDERTYSLLSIWSIGTHIFDIFRSYPYIYIYGVKAGGKSKVLTLTGLFANKAMPTVGMTVASLFRKIEKDKPTVLMDEVELLFKENNEELRLIAQSGYKRGSKVTRCVGDKHEPKDFEIYCPKMFASTMTANDIFESRCIPISMVRTLNRKIANKEIKTEDEFWKSYNILCHGIIEREVNKIKEIYEKIEDNDLFGRDWELWKPILSITKAVSDDIYNTVRDYAIEVSKQRLEDDVDNVKVIIAKKLLNIVVNDNWYSNSEILDNIKPELGWMNPQKLGYQMKALGFKSKSRGEGKGYELKVNQIKKIAQSFGIVPEEDIKCEKDRLKAVL